MSTPKKSTATKAAKKPGKLPSKPISFSNHPTAKGGKVSNSAAPSGKKGGVNLMRKLSGM